MAYPNPSRASSRVILLGGGGHALVLWSILEGDGVTIVGFTDPSGGSHLKERCPYLGHDDQVTTYDPEDVLLVNGLGSVRTLAPRRRLFDTFKADGYAFATVLHDRAIVDRHATIETGVQVMAGAVVQADAHVSTNTLINTGAVVDHGCSVGAHCHVASGATLSGDVQLGSEVHVGTGAAVIQGVSIGDRSVVGAGAVVVKDVPADTVVVGVPARPMTRSR